MHKRAPQYTYEHFSVRNVSRAISGQVLHGVAFGLGASIGITIGLVFTNLTLRATL